MATSTSTIGVDRLHETIVVSTQHIVASITSIETLLSKVLESQAQNQQQMMEMLKILSNNNNNNNNNNNSTSNAGMSNVGSDMEEEEEVVENESSEGDDNTEEGAENESSESDDNTEEVVENGSSDINEKQEDVNQVNQEDNQVDECNFEGYDPLETAIDLFDWKEAKKYLNRHRTLIQEIFRTRDSRKEINYILMKAASFYQHALVEEFLKLVPPETLEFVNSYGNTILHEAAFLGDIKIVKALVEKNPRLTQIWRRSSNEHPVAMPGVPLVYALTGSSYGKKEVVEYLCSVTRDEDPSPFSGENGAALLEYLTMADLYGTALSVCRQFPGLIQQIMDAHEDNGMPTLLEIIAERPFAFLSGSKLKWWERCIYTLIRVDTDSAHDIDAGIDRGKQYVSWESTTKEDEENPSWCSRVPSLCGQHCSSTSNNKTITEYISFHLVRYIRRVPLIRRLYDQKSMHQNVVALTMYLLREVKKKGMDEGSIKAMFLDSKMLENPMKFGTTEFVLECLRAFPFLCLDDWEGEVGRALIKLVVSERNETIYNFICLQKHMRQIKRPNGLDRDKNSILHYSAELPHNRRLNVVSGAAFQMQREIQWFKMVEITMLQEERFVRNKDGDTAHFLFTEKHKNLMEQGEKWMKDLSTSCMVVAALIATVAFAAAITVPGGNIQDNASDHNGLPVFLKRNSFIVFATADALALFSSITSVLMFLAVFTARYSEEDFLKALPQKLILGLATLFISMATILISFGAAFTIILGKRFRWTPIAVSLLSCAPVLLFGFLQFPLFLEMVSSTYWPTISRKQDYRDFETYFSDAERAIILARQRSTN